MDKELSGVVTVSPSSDSWSDESLSELSDEPRSTECKYLGLSDQGMEQATYLGHSGLFLSSCCLRRQQQLFSSLLKLGSSW